MFVKHLLFTMSVACMAQTKTITNQICYCFSMGHTGRTPGKQMPVNKHGSSSLLSVVAVEILSLDLLVLSYTIHKWACITNTIAKHPWKYKVIYLYTSFMFLTSLELTK